MPKVIIRQTIPTGATVENSDATYTDTVASGGTLVLPDTVINITDQLGNPLDTITFPVYTPVNIDIDSYIPPCADANYTLEDTAGAPLASGNIPSGGSDTIVAPDATIENSDASYSVTEVSGGTLVLPDSDIEVNGVNEGAIPSVNTVDIQVTDGTNPVTPNDVTVVGNTVTIEVPVNVFIKGFFESGNDTMSTLTIDADNAGTYTSITDDGGSGSISLSKNGGAFAAFSSPLILVATDTLVAKRTVTTNAGFYKITGLQ